MSRCKVAWVLSFAFIVASCQRQSATARCMLQPHPASCKLNAASCKLQLQAADKMQAASCIRQLQAAVASCQQRAADASHLRHVISRAACWARGHLRPFLETCRFVESRCSTHNHTAQCAALCKSSVLQGGQAFASLLSYTGMLRHWRHILWSSSSGLWSLGSSNTGERHAGITTGSLASPP